MSEVEPYTEEELRDKVAYGCPDCARLLATIEAYKAEARAEALEDAAIEVERTCKRHHFTSARIVGALGYAASYIRALKTTPTGGE